MMNFIIQKRNYIILFLIVILCLWLVSVKNNRIFLKSYSFHDKTVTIIIYDKVNIKKVSNKIKKIYKKYENLKDINIKNDLSSGADNESVLLSFSTNEVIKYFKKNKISKYIINADGNISAGKKYGDENYNISINNQKNGKVLKIVSLQNKSIVTVSSDVYDSVVVIGDDIINANLVAQAIKSLDVSSGEELAFKYNCEVLWYFNDEISLSNNFSKYIV